MFRLIVLNNERVLYEGMALSAILPGEEEEFSILPFHRPLISRLRRGIITVHPSVDHKPHSIKKERYEIRNTKYEIRIRGGIARMSKNELVILVE